MKCNGAGYWRKPTPASSCALNFAASYHTQPNFQDIATFIHMDEKKGLLYFDTTYWPYVSNSSSLVP